MAMKVLVVAAHPDDEILGCGATMALHAQVGDTVHSMIMATGITSRGGRDHEAQLGTLRKAAQRANDIVGVSSLKLCDFPDNKMDSVPLLDVVKVVEEQVAKFDPDVVYTHHAGDLNVDHGVVRDAVVTACRPLPGYKHRSILFFEVASSTEWQLPGQDASFVPNWFVGADKTLAKKLDSLRAYDSEMRPWPHPRSIEAVTHLARWRGASVGLEAAEAFMLGRRVVSL